MAELTDTVAAVRRFNRFYTRAIGVLERAYMGGPYTLAENRVLYEIAQGEPGGEGGSEPPTPSSICAALDLDAGYLTRILGRLERDGLVRREPSRRDGRSVNLALTREGRVFFATLNAKTVAQVEEMVGDLTAPEKLRLAQALDTAQTLLGPAPAKVPITLRPHAPGDMGWITERHGVLYGREYGWGPAIEAVTARICADFLDRFDPVRERCWVAERGGERIGCVFLVRETDEVARLRLLLLEPAARGEGLGRRLVDECVGFARAAGYREIVLWTHAVLTAARGIYAKAGFDLIESHTHDDFGREELSETWRLVL